MNVGLVPEMVFHVVGGLGIFLLGMKYMQQGLQVVAGDSIRRMINAVTANRFLAVGIGLFITTLVQSSSVTSVMVIGLVNSELMALTGAIGVIIGANIGTTITGWILALKIGQYGLPLLGLAAFGWLFIKGERLRYSALAMLGIGMVFFGLELMKDGFEPVSDLPEFASMFQLFEATDYLGVLKSALVGCGVTLVIQSSSATLGMTIALANTGVIDFQTAGAVVLGTNVGTTVTAYLASLGADDINAKRTAYFHILFNVAGVAAITALFLPVYLPFIDNRRDGRCRSQHAAAGRSLSLHDDRDCCGTYRVQPCDGTVVHSVHHTHRKRPDQTGQGQTHGGKGSFDASGFQSGELAVDRDRTIWL